MSLLNYKFKLVKLIIPCSVSLYVKINATKLSIERRREETGKLSSKKHDIVFFL